MSFADVRESERQMKRDTLNDFKMLIAYVCCARAKYYYGTYQKLQEDIGVLNRFESNSSSLK